MILRPLAIVAWLAVLNGCQPVEPASESAFEDVPRVENRADAARSDERSLHFELEQTFGVESEPFEATLTAVSGRVAVDDRGNVYLVVRGPRLLSFAPDGSLRWAVERRGEGPGELRGNSEVVWDGADRIYVGSAGLTRIDSWTTDGEFIESTALAEIGIAAARPIGFVAPDTLMLEKLGGDTGIVGGVLFLVDVRAWEVRLEKTIDIGTRFSLPEGKSLAVEFRAFDGTVVSGNVGAYELHFFDDDLELRRVVSVAPDPLTPPGIDPATGTVETYGEVRAPLRLDEGRWLVHSRSPADLRDPDAHARATARGTAVQLRWTTSLDLFSPDGHHLATWDGRMLDIGNPIAVDPDGRLYTISGDPYVHLRRYRIELTLE